MLERIRNHDKRHTGKNYKRLSDCLATIPTPGIRDNDLFNMCASDEKQITVFVKKFVASNVLKIFKVLFEASKLIIHNHELLVWISKTCNNKVHTLFFFLLI